MGGKNQNSASESNSSAATKPATDVPKKTTPPQSCQPPVKHWIGVRVEDEQGNVAKDITIHCKLSDATFDVDFGNALLDSTGVYKTDKSFGAGTCDFSIPAVYDVEWWDKSGAAPTAFPDEQGASLEAGECIVSGSAKDGYRSYHTVWDCSGNSDLKTNHPNPNQQSVGTAVRGPAKKTQTITKALDQSWTFVVRSLKPPSLTMVLIDKDGNPLSGKVWELSTLGQGGTTTGDGQIKVTSDKVLRLKSETLKVVMKAAQTPPTPSVVTPPTLSDPPPYPLPIVTAQFTDTPPPPDYNEQVVKWTLNVGSLEPFNVHKGALQRLQNLGFGCSSDLAGKSTADGEPQTIKAYNRIYTKTATTWDDIKEDIRDRHEKP